MPDNEPDYYDPDTSPRSLVPAAGNSGGFLTQPHRTTTTPALQAEAQRAKSEIEAALTIAQSMPRDEKECIDRILVACQRPGLAEKSQYRYARGGTDIVGPTIDLLEAIAQRWKNIEFGFRELARFPGLGSQPGESIVEAYSWDLESNVRRRTQFNVVHSIGLKGNKTKVLTDPRDVYEVIANQAQRRVRTCLENIIPRDVIEMAREECDKTLTAHVDITPEALRKLVDAFGKFGVTKAMIEARIQRRLDTVAPAQVVDLRKIWTSLRDGVGQVDDWFEVESKEPPKSAAEQAKEKMRKQQASPPAATETTAPASHPREPDDDEPAPGVQQPPQAEQDSARAQLDAEECLSAWGDQIAACEDLTACNKLEQESLPSAPAALRARILELILARRTAIRGKRGK